MKAKGWNVAGLAILGVGLVCVLVGLTITGSAIFNAVAPPAVLYSDDLKILNSPLRAGDTVVVLATRCAWNITGNATIPVEVTRQIGSTTSAAVIQLPNVHAEIPPGCNTIEGQSWVLPDDIDPGMWQLRGSVTARGRTTSYMSEAFEVIP